MATKEIFKKNKKKFKTTKNSTKTCFYISAHDAIQTFYYLHCVQHLLSHHMVVYCAFVCTVTEFSAAEKDSGVKLCVLDRLLSGMSFSSFGVGALYGGVCVLLTHFCLFSSTTQEVIGGFS